MPSLFTFANNVSTQLAGAVSTSATSITLSSAAHLPSSIPSGRVMVITVNDQATRQNFEVMYATAISGATLTVLRGQEGTTALSWQAGDFAYCSPTMGQMQAFGQLADANTWTGNNSFSNPVAVGAPVSNGQAVQLGQVRTKLQANTNFYVNASTGNDANNGLTPTTAWATLTAALGTIQQLYDLAGFIATINVAAGSYAPGICSGAFVGGISPNSVQVIASGAALVTNPSGTGAQNACFYATSGSQFLIAGSFTLVNSAAGGSCVQASGTGSMISTGAGISYGFSAGSHILGNAFGIVNVNGSYSIATNGGAGSHFNASTGGAVDVTSGITLSIGSNVNFTTAFSLATGVAQINAGGMTFSGSATGTRYNAQSNSMINTDGSGANYFPGNAAGITASGGIYI
ncbi:hypothetical protein [Burkholderia cenocepacia]|uniref:hypothetical protein n=1 Tax=Burkholderia cenocepacia TaxID=95486 RepID=UPI002B24DB16|nr:hypothetical protein [Burkholderia cenocepacia]MEB2545190.1 hypothetical protein [Burkholderia cenocepacia]